MRTLSIGATLIALLALCACSESDGKMRGRLDESARIMNMALIRAKTEVVELRKKAEQRLVEIDPAGVPMRPDPQTHRFFGDEGVYYKFRDDGGCGAWASGFTPVNDRVLREIALVESLGPDIAAIVNGGGLVCQCYILSSDHFGVFYPYLDSAAIFPPKANFYQTYAPFFEAAPDRNPGGGELWIRPYLDATGKGYMISISSPIHGPGGRYAGAAGGDIEAAALKSRFLDPERLQLLVTSFGIPLAATDGAIALLGLHDFSKFRYLEGVEKDAYASRELGLKDRDDLRDLAERLRPGAFFDWDFGGRTYRVYAAPVAETGWLLAELAER